MFRIVFVLVIAGAAAAQTPTPDTLALQALVTEIRQLRQDLQATTIVTQRVQIVLYRLQTQTALATRASSRLEDARASFVNAQSETKRVTGFIPLMEEDTKSTQDAAQRKAKEETLAQTKVNLERLAAREQSFQSLAIDAESQYRAEQGKLADLQDQLDRLDKLLDGLSRKQ
jgi:uncharacterized protein (DUF342 family)